ncbi:hypothetical protein CYMTET_15135 [Cymbomonas tetramitiformis]|uniref:Uncharacterized protein n=1 Tax=Cymbomonas tetramitiformis TaxID=36881 RepID=A0AAE0GEZ9_9CHLO|nr:hypothetical protein CYMTET_15135 [Cymbomonas tetramitiformis]
MSLTRALENVPHAFGGELELEWSVRPEACPKVAENVVEAGNLATLDVLEEARDVRLAVHCEYEALLRESAEVWPHAPLNELPAPRKETGLEFNPKAVNWRTAGRRVLKSKPDKYGNPQFYPVGKRGSPKDKVGLNLPVPVPVETAQPEHQEMFQTQDGPK